MWVEMGRHAGASWAIIDGHGGNLGPYPKNKGKPLKKLQQRLRFVCFFFFEGSSGSLVLEGPLETSRHTLNLQ